MSPNSGTRKKYVSGALALTACIYTCTAVAQITDIPFPPIGIGGDGGGPQWPKPLVANAPEPSPDPRNFDGTWYHSTLLIWEIIKDEFNDDIPIKPAARKAAADRLQSIKGGKPPLNAAAYCLPPGQPWQMELNMPFQIFQTPNRMEVLFEELHGLWSIAIDPTKAPSSPGYMNPSVAHWDGDTLVVETTKFKEPFWIDLDGTPASKDTKLTMRIRKVKTDHWFLDVEFKVDDPVNYTVPWFFVRAYDWRPDMTWCRDKTGELNAGAKGGLSSGMVPDPGLVQSPAK